MARAPWLGCHRRTFCTAGSLDSRWIGDTKGAASVDPPAEWSWQSSGVFNDLMYTFDAVIHRYLKHRIVFFDRHSRCFRGFIGRI